jgi:hypothetical protein
LAAVFDPKPPPSVHRNSRDKVDFRRATTDDDEHYVYAIAL